MHEPDTEAINAATKPEIGYEYRDMDVRKISIATFWFFAGTTICIAATLVGLLWTVKLPLRSTEPPKTIPAFPNPLLQGTMATKVDIAKLRHEEDDKLNRYGWVDESKGVAHIPIDKAIDLVAERGLNAKPSGESSPSGDGL